MQKQLKFSFISTSSCQDGVFCSNQETTEAKVTVARSTAYKTKHSIEEGHDNSKVCFFNAMIIAALAIWQSGSSPEVPQGNKPPLYYIREVA